jgi:hypothetical protein
MHTLNYASKHLPKTKITPPNINAREKSIDPFSTINKEQGHQKRGSNKSYVFIYFVSSQDKINLMFLFILSPVRTK